MSVVLDGDHLFAAINHGPWKMDVPGQASRADAAEAIHAAQAIGHGSSAARHAEDTAQAQQFQDSNGISESQVNVDLHDENKTSRKSSFIADVDESDAPQPPLGGGCECLIMTMSSPYPCRPHPSLLANIRASSPGVLHYHSPGHRAHYGSDVDLPSRVSRNKTHPLPVK